MITEACTSIKDSMKYYGNETNPGAHFPFNFVLINDLNDQSKAKNFNDAVHSWLDNMPSGKQANWVVNNILKLAYAIITKPIRLIKVNMFSR